MKIHVSTVTVAIAIAFLHAMHGGRCEASEKQEKKSGSHEVCGFMVKYCMPEFAVACWW